MILIRQFLALARLTALEAVRQPLCLVLAMTSVAAMALAAAQAYQFGEAGKFARDSALAAQFFFGAVMVAYGACTALSNEFRSGTVLAVLSKPVSRELYFVAKFAGVAAVPVLYSAFAIPCTLLCVAASPEAYEINWPPLFMVGGSIAVACAVAGVMNYFRRSQFASTALVLMTVLAIVSLAVEAWRSAGSGVVLTAEGHSQAVNAAIQWRILPAACLVTLALVVMAAVALALATILDTLPVVLLTFAVLLLGLMSAYVFGNSSAIAAAVARRLVPDWQLFWLADFLTGGGAIPWSYVGSACLYGSCIAGAALAAGSLLFGARRMERVQG